MHLLERHLEERQLSWSVTALTRPWPMPGKSTLSTSTMPPARRNKVRPTTWNRGRERIRKGVLDENAPAWHSLQARHLDVGRLQGLERGSTGHPVHVRDRDDREAEGRQHEQARRLQDVLSGGQ